MKRKATLAASLTTDKATYNAGDTITATFVRPPQIVTLTGTAGALVQSVTVSVTVPTALTDDGARTWTLKSDDGTTAVYTAKA